MNEGRKCRKYGKIPIFCDGAAVKAALNLAVAFGVDVTTAAVVVAAGFAFTTLFLIRNCPKSLRFVATVEVTFTPSVSDIILKNQFVFCLFACFLFSFLFIYIYIYFQIVYSLAIIISILLPSCSLIANSFKQYAQAYTHLRLYHLVATYS